MKEYTKWMIGLFQTSDPIIIFVEPNSEWFTVVQKLRQHAPTIIATMKFDDLVMSSTFTKEFWDYEHSIDLEAKVCVYVYVFFPFFSCCIQYQSGS